MPRPHSLLAPLAAASFLLAAAPALADEPSTSPPAPDPKSTPAPDAKPAAAAAPAADAKPASAPAADAKAATPDSTPAAAAADAKSAAAAPAADAKPDAPPAGEAPSKDPWYRFRPQLELGFLGVMEHQIKFGKDGTYFDLQSKGGQDNLYFIWRASMEVEVARQHNFTFLYQPLEIDSKVQLQEDLVVDDVTFAKGSPIRIKYGFPFYRFSYQYDFFRSDKVELSFGLSAQIRNATIEFESTNGEQLKSYRDIGFVPLLKSRGRYNFDNGLFAGYEVDAIYAPIRGVNGSDNEVTGALVDASLRMGLKLPLHSEAFLNVRYLGGGATGQSDPEEFSDGYTRNWLHFLTVSLGATISSF